MRNNEMAINRQTSERGAALASSLIMLSILAAVSMTVLAVVTHESRIAGSDLRRTQTFYAAAAGIEKMTGDFSALFAITSHPSAQQLSDIAAAYPTELTGEGFSFTKPDGTPNQSIVIDPNAPSGTVTIPTGPFSGLIASVTPYVLNTTAVQTSTGAQVQLQRRINNYLVPIFQFGMFSNEDLEIHPGPAFTFNGRVHANGNLYISGTTTFLSRVTTANELVTDLLRNGNTHAEAMNVQVGAVTVPLTMGSVTNGPNLSGSSNGTRGYFPGSPNGTVNSSWDSTSVAAASSTASNQFGGQVLTRSTGGMPLLLPMQLEGNSPREIIKRELPSDSMILNESRYHYKSQIKILIDDEGNSANDAAGIATADGVYLSTFLPVPLPNRSLDPNPANNGGGRALWLINDNNTGVANSYNEIQSPNKSYPAQMQNAGPVVQADTVRGIQKAPALKLISNVTKAGSSSNIVITTSVAHGFANNDKVFISNLSGAPQALGAWTISNVTSTTFQLSGTNTSSYNLSPAYTANTGTLYSFTALPKSSNGTVIPSGSGVTGHIVIQIVDSTGTIRDVTSQVLSMGMTEGEPNAIVMLQRPLWAAYTQGSRDASGAALNAHSIQGDPDYANSLTDILTKTRVAADGQINPSTPVQDTTWGFLKGIQDDITLGNQPIRNDMPGGLPTGSTCVGSTQPVMCELLTDWGGGSWSANRDWNSIVPINAYNVREGRINSGLTATTIYDRGITPIVEINMRNLARWVDGVFDNNLLQGGTAVSANIASPDGYTVYVSDRRGDKVRSMTIGSSTFNATNGMADNEDIYGPNGSLDAGEDVQQTGALVKDTSELSDPTALSVVSPGYGTDRNKQAIAVNDYLNLAANGIDHQQFRGAVRLFNGEDLMLTGNTGKLSNTKGITISSENMVYIWGNYNTTGIAAAPAAGTSTLNDGGYLGDQVPSSIVCDAFFPLSKTFFDSELAMYPDDMSKRQGDRTNPTVAQETSARVAIIAGNNLSALAGSPDAGNSSSGESRLCGGMHNFPRFLEDWNMRWNFVGSLIPLYHSTQALGQYNAESTIYGPPLRNWAFDITYTDPNRLPPGTPLFQHIEPTGFKQVL
jgi:hypothetical protein